MNSHTLRDANKGLLSKFSSASSALLICALMSSFAHAGTRDAGGGDAILCQDGKLYAWDYIQTKPAENDIDPEILKAKSSSEILAIIYKRLLPLNPFLADSFADFMKRNEDPLKPKEKRVWISGVNPLIDLNDETFRRIPRSCTGQLDKAKIKDHLRQGVIRTKKAGTDFIIYEYDSEVFSLLEANSPVQLSFLLVHEWLRDYTDSPLSLMRAGRLLHSKSLTTTTSNQLNRALLQFGVRTPHVWLGDYEGTAGPIDAKVQTFSIRQNQKGEWVFNAKTFDDLVSDESIWGGAYYKGKSVWYKYQLSRNPVVLRPVKTLDENGLPMIVLKGEAWVSYQIVEELISEELLESEKKPHKQTLLQKDNIKVIVTVKPLVLGQDIQSKPEYSQASFVEVTMPDLDFNLKPSPGKISRLSAGKIFGTTSVVVNADK